MTTIAHISDPHFGTVDVPVRDALIAELRASAIDLVVLTGDITQRARRSQFREAREFLDALSPKPWIAIPGNHDIPLFDVITRFVRPYRLFHRFISSELEPLYEHDDVALMCVNATRRTRHKNGVLPEADVMRAAQRLSRLPQPFRVIATHQPLAVTLDTEIHNLARGAVRALEHWIDAGADLFIGGHIHLPYCTLAQTQRSARTAVVLQAGTAVSLRVRHGVPNSYNRLTFKASNGVRHMQLERCDYDAATKSFAMKHTYRAQSTPSGWRLED
jgi:DNA repair exonuclease SbcCD nuclease subunit